MRTYRTEQVTVTREVLTGGTCDGCGTASNDPDFDFVLVEIAVGATQEGGGWNDLELCNDCLVERAPVLRAAGSTAPLVTGEPGTTEATEGGS